MLGGFDRPPYGAAPSVLFRKSCDLVERVASVGGDGAHDTNDCHEAIALRDAHAIIPTRKNARPRKANRFCADARNDILRTIKRLGRQMEEMKRLSSAQPC